VLIFPTLYALTGGLILQKLLGYTSAWRCGLATSPLFGIAVETGVVIGPSIFTKLLTGGSRLEKTLKHEDIEEAVIEGAVRRLRPKTHDRLRSAGESHSYFVGERYRLGCDETDCRAARRRHDHVHHSRANSRARLLCIYERGALRRGTLHLAGRGCGKRLTTRRQRVFRVAGLFDEEDKSKGRNRNENQNKNYGSTHAVAFGTVCRICAAAIAHGSRHGLDVRRYAYGQGQNSAPNAPKCV